MRSLSSLSESERAGSHCRASTEDGWGKSDALSTSSVLPPGLSVMSLATATWGCRLSTSPPQCAPIIQNDGDEDTPRASYREHYRQPRSLCVCRLPLHDMASDAAPREGESRLHELLEKTIQAVTKLNDSIVGLSESQSHAGHRRSIQVSLVSITLHA